MLYTYKWIEGERNLETFCAKCFKAKPTFTETIGHCDAATIELTYKFRADRAEYVPMFFLYMQHHTGTVSWNELRQIRHYDYEQIRADKSSLLVNRE